MSMQCSDADKMRGLIEENDQLKNYIKLLEGAMKASKVHRSLSSYLRTLFLKFIGNR